MDMKQRLLDLHRGLTKDAETLASLPQHAKISTSDVASGTLDAAFVALGIELGVSITFDDLDRSVGRPTDAEAGYPEYRP